MSKPEEGRMKNKKKSGWWKVELKEEKKIETEEERERESKRLRDIFRSLLSDHFSGSGLVPGASGFIVQPGIQRDAI